jgi:PAS domain S-box-containing protein
MPPAFVVTFTALMVSGPIAATSVAAAAAVAAGVLSTGTPRGRMFIDAAIVVAGTWTAGLAYQAAGDVSVLEWPWLAVPIAAAVVAYHLVQGALASVVVPLLARKPIDAEVIDGRLWNLAPVVAAVLVLACRAYIDYVQRLREVHRRRELIEHVEHGMSVLDRDGRVTHWNAAIERMLQSPAGRALGRLVTDVVPALARTGLPEAVAQTLADGQGRMLNQVRLPAGAGTSVLQIKVLPVADGVALVWQDVTERMHAEEEIRQSSERLALAAEGANDGLWQWDLKTQEFYVSGRWCAMVGLPARAASGRPAEWLDRVHPDDVANLNAALAAHLAGSTPVFQHEHRLRHEDGVYRQFLCRGVALKTEGRKPDRIAGSLTDTTEHAASRCSISIWIGSRS